VIKEAMAEIANDCQSDAESLDGQPFNGKVVATQLGNQLAMIRQIALAVAQLENRLNELATK